MTRATWIVAILCALAVQFVLAGVAESTAGVILREAAAPYAN